MKPRRELSLGARLRMLAWHRPERSRGRECRPHYDAVHISLTKPSHRQGFVNCTPRERPRVLDPVDTLLVHRSDKPSVDNDGGARIVIVRYPQDDHEGSLQAYATR